MAHAYLIAELADTRTGATVTVTGDEARHAVKVARLRTGESIILVNGRGLRANCEVTATASDSFTVTVLEASTEPRLQPQLHLSQALAKGGRDEAAVQAAVELGVDSVIPWQAQRSVSQWRGDKVEKQRARWAAICREATKQSLRSWQPEVREFALGVKALPNAIPGAQLLVLDPWARVKLSEVSLEADDLLLVVGPEGGLSEQELDHLMQAGAQSVRLGDSVLRTSTAGAAALSVLQLRLGRW